MNDLTLRAGLGRAPDETHTLLKWIDDEMTARQGLSRLVCVTDENTLSLIIGEEKSRAVEGSAGLQEVRENFPADRLLSWLKADLAWVDHVGLTYGGEAVNSQGAALLDDALSRSSERAVECPGEDKAVFWLPAEGTRTPRPKFEIALTSRPENEVLLQIDCQMTSSFEDIRHRLGDAAALHVPDLVGIACSVAVASPWPGIGIRVDLRGMPQGGELFDDWLRARGRPVGA